MLRMLYKYTAHFRPTVQFEAIKQQFVSCAFFQLSGTLFVLLLVFYFSLNRILIVVNEARNSTQRNKADKKTNKQNKVTVPCDISAVLYKRQNQDIISYRTYTK